MRSATVEFRRTMAERRNFVNYANVTLSNGTRLTLEPPNFRLGGNTIHDDLTNGSDFSIGTAIGKTITMTLDNTDESLSPYDFYGAMIDFYVALPLPTEQQPNRVEKLQIGQFTVITPATTGSVITMEAVDNMYKFDKPYSESTLTYPATLQQIVAEACIHCGVANNTGNFRYYNTTVSNKPDASATYRQVLSYVAQLACSNAKIDPLGGLTFMWYGDMPQEINKNGGTFNTSTTPYSDGDNLNGGTFAFNDGDTFNGGTFTDVMSYHILGSSKNISVCTDDVVITGVKVKNGDTEVLQGTEDYCITIDNNPLVQGIESTVATNLFSILNGYTFRPFSVSYLQDPTIEAGDWIQITDVKRNTYITLITNVQFTTGSYMNITCNAQPPAKQGSTYVSSEAKAIVAAQRIAAEELSTYDIAVQRMQQLASNASGLYWLEVPQSGGGSIFYQSNRPMSIDGNGNVVFTQGSHAWKITSSGFFNCTSTGTSEATTTWTGGIDADNNAVMNTIAAIGINANWINAGSIDADLITAGRIRDRYNYNYWDLDSGEFKLAALPANQTISDPDAPNSGAYVPTNNNLPASGWTDEQKKQHVGETFYNTSNKKTYIYKGSTIFETAHPYPAGTTNNYYHISVPKGSYGVYIQFDSRSATETNWDYIDIYKRNYQGNYYKARFTGSIGQKYFSIDGYTYGTTNDIWVVWTTDSSVTDWGWRIDVVDTPQGTDASSSFSADTLPSYSWTNITWGNIVSYDWVEASLEEYVDAKVPSDVNLTQEEIFDILTDHQQNQGLFLSGNKLYINGEMFATNALMIGKNPNTGYEPYLEIYNSSGTKIGKWDKNGIEANAGKFGKLHVYTDNNNQTFLKYVTSGNRIYLNQTWGAGQLTDYNRGVRLVINPYKEGWLADGKINVNFSMSVRNVSSYKTATQCTIKVYKYAGSSHPLVKTVQLRYDGYTSGGYYGLDYTFDHTYGANEGELYYVVFTIEKRNATYTNNGSTTLTVNDNALGSGFVVREGTDHRALATGRFQGELLGDAVLDTLKVGEYILCGDGDIVTSSSNYGSYISYDGIRIWSGAADFGDSNNKMQIFHDDICKESGGTDYYAQFSSSDERVKEDIEDLDHELSKNLINGTRTREFTFVGSEGRHYGVIAQEARELLNNLGEEDSQLEYIAGRPDGKIPNQRNVNYNEYIPHLINYVKDLRSEIDLLKAEIKELKGE